MRINWARLIALITIVYLSIACSFCEAVGLGDTKQDEPLPETPTSVITKIPPAATAG